MKHPFKVGDRVCPNLLSTGRVHYGIVTRVTKRFTYVLWGAHPCAPSTGHIIRHYNGPAMSIMHPGHVPEGVTS